VLTDRSDLTAGRDFAVASPSTWRLADLSTKYAFLEDCVLRTCTGLGRKLRIAPLITNQIVSTLAGIRVLFAPTQTGFTYGVRAGRRETACLLQRR